MSSKKLSISFCRCLHRLSLGEELKASEISSKALLKKFVDDGQIKERTVSKQRRTYTCANAEGLHKYLDVQYEIVSLSSYIAQLDGDRRDGEHSLEATKSSKTFREHGLQGFFIKAYDSNIYIEDEKIPCVPSGTALFIHETDKLKLSPDALVIGIENPECFVKFEQLRALFPEKELVLVMRYMSLSPNKWLASIQNPYLHFGDFDPAGIAIYIHEYRNKLGAERCQFFVPENIDDLIRNYGSASLFDKQINQHKTYHKADYPELKYLTETMDKYKMGLEQERLLSIYS